MKKYHCRIAFTLVELMIAITIASVLTLIAVPTLKDSMRQNSLSRSASMVKGAFINARAQAIQTGRPYGVVIERRRNNLGSGAAADLNFLGANYSTRLYYVQSPIEYRGDINESAAIPYFETPGSGASVIPRFFFPEAQAGLLASVARFNDSPARRLISRGTRFSVGESGYVFEIEDMTYVGTTNAVLPGTPGTIVSFNYIGASPQSPIIPATLTAAATNSVFPNALPVGQPVPFKFRVNPIRAPLAPVNMIGRTVVDLSISGPSSDPLAFNAQEIIDADPSTTIPPLLPDVIMNDVVVMFAPDGRLDGVYVDQRQDNTVPEITGFIPFRVDPSTTVAFNVGFVDGILDNIDDASRYPDLIGTPDYQVTPDDPAAEGGSTTVPLDVSKVPNYANTDCAWISIQPLSGAIRLDTVASQPPAPVFNTYYGFSATPTARSVVRARVHQSRRLTTGGTVGGIGTP